MREFIAIITGDEILNCSVKDENGFWLCSEMNSLGFFTKEIVYIRDNLENISSHIKRSLSMNIDVIIITGGLGPTYDDKTLRAVSIALGKDLKLNEEALKMVKMRYDSLYNKGIIKDKELNKNREKMAILPDGSIPIRNNTGAAPGVMLKIGNTLIFALPGVPSEMKSMFNEEIKKILIDEFGQWTYLEKNIFLDHRDESTITETLEKISRDHGIYVKSRSGILNGERKMVITLALRSEDQNVANERMNMALNELLEYLKNKNINYLIQ
ncbi:MAG: competence/damage-inducible protein A [Thermoplasmata archaeon]|nr:molybdopterin-binding protein [Thermoplasmata archaeon]